MTLGVLICALGLIAIFLMVGVVGLIAGAINGDGTLIKVGAIDLVMAVFVFLVVKRLFGQKPKKPGS